MKVAKNKLLTVGMKILLGVALSSTICIGGLVYTLWQVNRKVEANSNDVLVIRQEDSRILREMIVNLQSKMLSFDQYLKTDSGTTRDQWLNEKFTLVKTNRYEDRESWGKLFSRTERRDLANNKPVIKQIADTLSVSAGTIDSRGTFTGVVVQNIFRLPGDTDFKETLAQLALIADNPMTGDTLTGKLAQLSGVIADEAMNAELARTNILNSSEAIEQKERELAHIKQVSSRLILFASGAFCLINLAVIFLLTRVIVEHPLRTLIIAINALRAGEAPTIPWLGRKDQIGILASAVDQFKSALLKIKHESRRKQQEKNVIDETLQMMSETIHQLGAKAISLKTMSAEMEALAETTSSKVAFVARRAENTAEMTQKVAGSTDRLQESVQGIQTELHRQNSVVLELDTHVKTSREIIDDLDHAARDIKAITTIVKEISDQTKLLALNASIEAARVGKHGQGFAVVAREVKELSSETERATADIKEKVETIENVCSQMSNIIRMISDQTVSLQHAALSIEGALEDQQENSATITGLVHKSLQDTQDVSEHIQQVRKQTAKTATISSQVGDAAKVISDQLTGLLSETTGKLQHIGELNKAA